MNVLSLFNGMSCARMAIDELKLPIGKYYSSEVDKFANQLTNYLYPDTINLGDVRNVDVSKLEPIDIIFAGSPCQSFSFAGKRKGMATKCELEITNLEQYLQLKSENFEFEGQSYLFWEFIRILEDCRKINPNVKFLLENVEMGEKWEKVLSKAVGYNGIHINSALVSAQSRKRIYWVNFGLEPRGLFGDLESIIPQPKDKGILLKHILEDEVDEKYFLSEKMIEGFERHKERHNEKGTGFGYVPKTEIDKGNSLRANAALCPTDNMVIVYNNKRLNETFEKHKDELENGILINSYNKTIHKDKSITISTRINASNNTHIYDKTIKSLNKNQQKKFNPNINSDKANALTLAQGRAGSSSEYMDAVSKIANITSRIRRLTPKECLRLQTVPEHLIEKILKSGISDTQIYKMAGNGWTIDAIKHLLSHYS